MYADQLTDDAKRFIMEANTQSLRSESLGAAQSLLLCLVRDDSLASRILERIGYPRADLYVIAAERFQVELPALALDVPQILPPLYVPLQEILALALDEAHQLSNSYIGVEHLLFALIRDTEYPAGKLLRELGLELERARRQVMAFATLHNVPESRNYPESDEISPGLSQELHRLYQRLANSAREQLKSEGIRLHRLPVGWRELLWQIYVSKIKTDAVCYNHLGIVRVMGWPERGNYSIGFPIQFAVYAQAELEPNEGGLE